MSNLVVRVGLLAVGASFLLSSACAFSPPGPITRRDTWFGTNASDSTYTQLAERCVSRVDRHGMAVRRSYYTSTGFSIAGAALAGTAGAGGGLAAVLSSNDGVQEVGGVLAIVGGVVGAIGSAISIGLADPQGERLEMYYASLDALRRAERLARNAVDPSVTAPTSLDMSLGPTWQFEFSEECTATNVTWQVREGRWCRGSTCAADASNVASCSALRVRRGLGRTLHADLTEAGALFQGSGRCVVDVTCPRAEALANRNAIMDALQACEASGSQPRDREATPTTTPTPPTTPTSPTTPTPPTPTPNTNAGR